MSAHQKLGNGAYGQVFVLGDSVIKLYDTGMPTKLVTTPQGTHALHIPTMHQWHRYHLNYDFPLSACGNLTLEWAFAPHVDLSHCDISANTLGSVEDTHADTFTTATYRQRTLALEHLEWPRLYNAAAVRYIKHDPLFSTSWKVLANLDVAHACRNKLDLHAPCAWHTLPDEAHACSVLCTIPQPVQHKILAFACTPSPWICQTFWLETLALLSCHTHSRNDGSAIRIHDANLGRRALQLERMQRTFKDVLDSKFQKAPTLVSTASAPSPPPHGTIMAEARERHNVIDFLVMMRDLLQSLSNVHDRGWIHQDIKPANILHATATNQRTVLCDFSIASLATTVAPRRSGLTAPAYRAPEQFAYLGYGPAADIWALACTLFEYWCPHHLTAYYSDLVKLWSQVLTTGQPRRKPHRAKKTRNKSRANARVPAQDEDKSAKNSKHVPESKQDDDDRIDIHTPPIQYAVAPFQICTQSPSWFQYAYDAPSSQRMYTNESDTSMTHLSDHINWYGTQKQDPMVWSKFLADIWCKMNTSDANRKSSSRWWQHAQGPVPTRDVMVVLTSDGVDVEMDLRSLVYDEICRLHLHFIPAMLHAFVPDTQVQALLAHMLDVVPSRRPTVHQLRQQCDAILTEKLRQRHVRGWDCAMPTTDSASRAILSMRAPRRLLVPQPTSLWQTPHMYVKHAHESNHRMQTPMEDTSFTYLMRTCVALDETRPIVVGRTSIQSLYQWYRDTYTIFVHIGNHNIHDAQRYDRHVESAHQDSYTRIHDSKPNAMAHHGTLSQKQTYRNADTTPVPASDAKRATSAPTTLCATANAVPRSHIHDTYGDGTSLASMRSRMWMLVCVSLLQAMALAWVGIRVQVPRFMMRFVVRPLIMAPVVAIVRFFQTLWLYVVIMVQRIRPRATESTRHTTHMLRHRPLCVTLQYPSVTVLPLQHDSKHGNASLDDDSHTRDALVMAQTPMFRFAHCLEAMLIPSCMTLFHWASTLLQQQHPHGPATKNTLGSSPRDDGRKSMPPRTKTFPKKAGDRTWMTLYAPNTRVPPVRISDTRNMDAMYGPFCIRVSQAIQTIVYRGITRMRQWIREETIDHGVKSHRVEYRWTMDHQQLFDILWTRTFYDHIPNLILQIERAHPKHELFASARTIPTSSSQSSLSHWYAWWRDPTVSVPIHSKTTQGCDSKAVMGESHWQSLVSMAMAFTLFAFDDRHGVMTRAHSTYATLLRANHPVVTALDALQNASNITRDTCTNAQRQIVYYMMAHVYFMATVRIVSILLDYAPVPVGTLAQDMFTNTSLALRNADTMTNHIGRLFVQRTIEHAAFDVMQWITGSMVVGDAMHSNSTLSNVVAHS